MASYSGHVEHGMCRITSMRSQLPYHAYHPLLKHLYSLAQVSCPVVAESGKHFALSQKARSFSGAPKGGPGWPDKPWQSHQPIPSKLPKSAILILLGV